MGIRKLRAMLSAPLSFYIYTTNVCNKNIETSFYLKKEENIERSFDVVVLFEVIDIHDYIIHYL